LDEEANGNPIPLSSKVISCPYISKNNLISRTDFETQSQQLHAELNNSILKLQLGELQWLTLDLTLVRDGYLSNTERFRAIEAFLPKINNI
jgi:hypothetical protein